MMTRLVAVSILPYAARNVRLSAPGRPLGSGKKTVQTLLEGLFPAKRLHKAGYIMRHKETVLPGVRLGVVVVHLTRIERTVPASVKARPHKARRRVQHVAPILRAGHITLILFILPQIFGHLSDAPVVIREFQRLGHALVLIVGKHQAVAPEAFHAEFRPQRTGYKGLESLFDVKTTYPARHGVGNYRGRIVTYHTFGLPARKLPHRQLSVLLPNGNHAVDEVGAALGLYFKEQRMLAAEGVPGAEHGVPLPAVGHVDPAVHPPVLSVVVGVQRGVYPRMIERRIKAAAVLPVAERALEF